MEYQDFKWAEASVELQRSCACIDRLWRPQNSQQKTLSVSKESRIQWKYSAITESLFTGNSKNNLLQER